MFTKKKNKNIKVVNYLNKLITNKNIQNIKILDCTHYLHHSQYKEMSKFISENL